MDAELDALVKAIYASVIRVKAASLERVKAMHKRVTKIKYLLLLSPLLRNLKPRNLILKGTSSFHKI